MNKNYFLKYITWFIIIFPKKGAQIIDDFFLNFVGHSFTNKFFLRQNLVKIKKIGNLSKICVLADVNLGDAIIIQAAVRALRESLPKATIDYVIAKSAKDLIEGNPMISNLFPVYSKSSTPSSEDIKNLKDILFKNNYDVVLNFCPFLNHKDVNLSQKKTIDYTGLAISLLNNQKDQMTKNHMTYRIYHYTRSLFERNNSNENYKGESIYISQKAIIDANYFFKKNNLHSDSIKILFNPDTNSRFTRVPLNIQIALLEKLSKLPCDILLDSGHVTKGIEQIILSSLSVEARKKITIIPTSIKLDTYAALIDNCNFFITGDTGPLHIAAAMKICKSKDFVFKNQTSIISIFGATPPKIYGYDSNKSGYLPANQKSSSFTLVSESDYRSIACIIKSSLTFKNENVFFDQLDVNKIVDTIINNSIFKK